MDGGLKVPIPVQKVGEGIFCDWYTRGVVRILIREFRYEQKPSIGEDLLSSGEFHYAKVEGRLKEEIDAQPTHVGNNADLHFIKMASILQRLTGSLNLFLVIGFASL